MLRFLVLASVVLTVYALVDCVRTPRQRVRNLPKPLWVLVIVVLPVLGAVVWLLVGKDRARPSGRPQRPRPVAPDDDPDFLRRIDEQRRQEQRRRERADRGEERGDEGTAPRT